MSGTRVWKLNEDLLCATSCVCLSVMGFRVWNLTCYGIMCIAEKIGFCAYRVMSICDFDGVI